MADVKLRIEVNPDAETERIGYLTNYVNSAPTNSNIANTSIQANVLGGYVSGLEDIDKYGSNGLVFLSDDNSSTYDFVFDDNDYLSNSGDSLAAILEDEEIPNEFIWGIVPASGEYSVKLTFTGATMLDKIVIYGDNVVNQFPTEAIIDGNTTIYNNDNQWAISLGNPSSTHTIEFTKWNRTNYNACLSDIRVMFQYYEIDKTNGLMSVSSHTESTPNASEINYGVFANTGSLEIVDADTEIEEMVNDGVIPPSSVPIELYLNDKKIQTHISSDSDYDIVNKTFKVSLGNNLNYFDKLKYSGYIYPDESRTLYDIVDDAFGQLGYLKESIKNWVRYYNANSFYVKNDGGYKITVQTVSGWEIIGVPVKVTPNASNTLSFVYSNKSAYTTYDGNGGIPCQILNSYPTNNNCSSISISTTRLSNSVVTDQQVSISFTPSTDSVYLIFNFGYANDSQEIEFTIKNISLNGVKSSDLLQNEILDNNNKVTVKNYLESITIGYPYIEYGKTFREVFDYICQIAQLQFILDDNGQYKFIQARPVVKQNASKIIKVPEHLVITNLQYDMFKKNKFDGVEMSEAEPIVETETDTRLTTKLFDDYDSYTDFFNYELNINDIQHSNGVGTEDPFGIYAFDDDLQPITCGWWSRKYKNELIGYAYCLIKDYYKTITFSIPYTDENGLDKILDVQSGTYRGNSPNYTVYYRKSEDTAYYMGAQTPKEYFDSSVGDIGSGPIYSGIVKSAKTTATFDQGTPITISATATQGQDASYLNVTRNDTKQRFDIECRFIVAQKIVRLSRVRTSSAVPDNWENENIPGTVEWHAAEHIEISVYGTKKVIRFEDVSASTENIENAKIIATLNSNNLLQTTTTKGSQKISDVIKSNILSDYSNGIRTANISIFCHDLYYLDGTIAKSFNDGQILEIGDIIVFNDIMTDTDNSTIYWRVIGRTFDYNGNYVEHLTLQEVIGDIYFNLEDLSWDEINYLSESGLAPRFLRVGDEKTVTMGGEESTFAIMGFNHDDLANGTGKAGITFGMTNLCDNKIVMNGLETNAGGWEYSILRIALNNTYNNLLDSDLKRVIKAVNKKSSAGNQSITINTTSDKLWIFSEVEVDGTTTGVYSSEGTRYDYWKTASTSKRVKKLANGTGSTSNWWLRSANISETTSFVGFSTSGLKSNYAANTEQGICIGFCV